MFQGFFNLSSQMLTQNRTLNVISNNMANVSTPGYKADTLISSSFRTELMARMDGRSPAPIGSKSFIRTAVETVSDFTNAGYQTSEGVFDFALAGEGFFVVQTEDGEVYTRNGSFSLDEQGYLILPAVGQVLGENGPIQFTTDNIEVADSGMIYNKDTGEEIGKLRVVDFENYNTDLLKSDNNVFENIGNPGTPINTPVKWKALEQSNVNVVQEMASMMESQRALQSASQVLKIYDQLTGKMVSQLGPA